MRHIYILIQKFYQKILMKFKARLCFYTCVSFCSGVGGGWLPRMHHRLHDQGGLHPGRGLHPGGGGLHPGGGVCIQEGGLHLGGLHPVGVGRPYPPTRYMEYYGIRSTSGRYASYWNAFLFKTFLINFLPPANEVWGKVICLQVSVCPQRGCLVRGDA